jgi:multiple antibiotic resistance protein
MTEFVLGSFTALFVTVNPIKGAAVFAVLSRAASRPQQRRLATRATLIASGILLIFAVFGDDLLSVIGVGLPAVRVGGGILLLLLAIGIVFGRSIASSDTGEELDRGDIAVFPLATPIIAGPGAITAVVVQASGAENRVQDTALLVLALAAVMLLTFVGFLTAGHVERWLGGTGMNVVTRILGILLAAVSAELILVGLRESGVFRSG